LEIIYDHLAYLCSYSGEDLVLKVEVGGGGGAGLCGFVAMFGVVKWVLSLGLLGFGCRGVGLVAS